MTRRIALLICNNDYKSLAPLRTPINNGKKLESILIEVGGFDEVVLKPNLTGLEMQIEISSFLNHADDYDEILIYFSGHGAIKHEELFLNGVDTPKYDSSIASIDRLSIFHKINDSTAKQFLLIIDSCYSGGMTQIPDFVSTNKKIEILTSSGATDYSYEPTEDDNSLFTYFSQLLIDAIEKGKAGKVSEKFITAKDIYEYLIDYKTIEKVAPKYNPTTVGASNSYRVTKNLFFDNNDNGVIKDDGKSEIAIQYLDWLLREHSYLKLHGIHSAHNFKGVALENIYVALRGEKSSSYEKAKAKNLSQHYAVYFIDEKQDVDEDFLYDLELDYLQENPVMPSIMERDKIPSEYDIPITIGEAFRDERFLIILGDPGSGKTTLAKWLAIQLARAYKEVLQNGIGQDVLIPESKIDPYIDLGSITYNLGPARFPILLSIADYAQVFSELYHNKKLTLIEYIGTHKWRGKIPSFPNDEKIPPNDLQKLFEHFLKKGETVVILDGMDEVTKHRSEIVSQIESFISKWVINKGDEKIPIDFNLDWRHYAVPRPGDIGGNQVIITSRIVGYHLSPITKSITHVTIEPMKKKAIGRFCNMWMDELHKMEYGDKFPEDTVLNLAKSQAEMLKNAIFSDRQILELATNPLLITIIALVYRNNEGRLPSHRAALYQEALITLIKTWKQPALSVNEVEYVLSAVAQTIHVKYPKGLIKESELSTIIEKHLALYRGYDIKEMPSNFNEKTVKPFINEIRNKVGIIAPRGDKVYGFIHLTFQEYLTARYLTKDKYKTTEQVLDYLDNPRWKVPLLMAIGHISVNNDWDSDLFSEILNSVLDSDSNLSQIFPRSALLLSDAFAEISLEKVSSTIIEKVIFNLLEFYNNQEKINRFPKLKRRIEKGFVLIKRSDKGEIMEQVLYELLTKPPESQTHLVPVAVKIIYENRWFSKKIVPALYEAIKFDSEEWNWIINRTLTKLVSDQLAIPKPKEPKRPDSPKTKFEKAIEKHKSDLEKLSANELEQEVKEKIRSLESLLPASKLKLEISIRSQLIRFLNDEIKENYRIIEKILDYTFEKDLKRTKNEISELIRVIKKSEKSDFKTRLFLQEVQNYTYIEVIDKVLSKVQNDEVTIEINNNIDNIKLYLNKTTKDYQELLQELKQITSDEELINFQKELSKIIINKSKFYSYPSFEELNEGIDKTMYLCHVLLNITDYNGYLEKIETEFTEQYIKIKHELKQLHKRSQNIQDGTEKDVILNEINNIKETIKKEHFSTAQYKEDWRKFNFTYQYYEDALEKYQEQEIYPFEEYKLSFQNNSEISLSSFREHCLFTLLWGGYKDRSQIEVWRKYDETASFLQKPDSERVFAIESNPYYYYGKYGIDDVVYSAAVHLDTNVIRLDDFRDLKKVKHDDLKPIFSRSFKYRKTTLSDELIHQKNHFQALNFITNESNNDKEIIDATILKAFTQNNPKNAIEVLSSSKYRNEIIKRLRAIKSTLDDAVFASFPFIFKELEKLSETLSADEWFVIYQKIYSTLLKARKSAFPTKNLLEIAPEKYKSVILADHWYTTSTLYQDDIVYEFAVMLDTCVKKEWSERIKNAFLQISIAPTFYNRKQLLEHKDWIVSKYISSDIFREDEIPIDVLSAIENYNLFGDVRTDLTKAFQEVYLNRLIEYYIDDAHPQKYELILFCLQNSMFGEGLEKFLPHNVRSVNYIQNELLPQIMEESDNYYKSRALIRFIPYARNQEKILVKLFECYQKISVPFEKAQINILLRQKNIYKDIQELDNNKFIEIIAAIQNPLKKIKAIIEGYSFIFEDNELQELHEALFQSIKKIEDLHLKGRVLNLIFYSEINLEFKKKLKKYLNNYDDETIYNLGLSLTGLDLLLNEKLFEKQKQTPEKWTPVLLYAAIDDIVNYFSPPEKEQSLNDLWNNLKDKPSLGNVPPLILRGIEKGLEITPKAVEVINDLALSKYSELLTLLYPLLHCNNGSVLWTVEQWQSSSNDTLKNYASLYQAEFYNKINVDNIDGLLNLKLSLDSRTYCRVNLVLSQGITAVKRNLPRKYKLSELFEESIIQKIIESLTIEKKYGTRRSLISCVLWDLELDSFKFVEEILKSDSLRVLFLYSSDLLESVEADLANFIASDNFDVEFMLESVTNIIIQNFCEHDENKQRLYKKLHQILLEIYPKKLKSIRFIPHNVFSLINAYQNAKEKSVDKVRFFLEKEMVGLDEVLKGKYEDNKEVINSGLLIVYGYHFDDNYIFPYNSNDIIKVKEAYSDVIFEFFLDWFVSEIKTQRIDSDITLELILVSIAIWTDEKNISILNDFNKDNLLYNTLLDAIQKVKKVGVFACINILKFINQHSKKGIELILQKRNSSPHIQIAVIKTLNDVKSIDKDSLEYILDRILENDPLSSSIYISILSNHAKDSNTKIHVRKKIINSLINCLNDDRSNQGIYQYSHNSGTIDSPVKVQYVGRLDEVIFKAIVGIVDI